MDTTTSLSILLILVLKINLFDIKMNGEVLCTAYTDEDDTNWQGQAACNAAVYATEGQLSSQHSVSVCPSDFISWYCLI